MKHKYLFLPFLTALCILSPLSAQNDTVRILRTAQVPERTQVSEQSFATEDTPELQKTPDSLVRVEVTTIKYFTDTLTRIISSPDSVAKQREEVIKTDSTDRRGHYIEAHVGLGYGSLGYTLDGADNRVNGSFSALLQLQYAYFFHPNWGVGAGLWFTNYTSFARLGGAYTWTQYKNGDPLIDTDLEQNYHHTATVRAWRERETLHNLGIPISLQFQYQKENWKARIFAAVGIAPSFSVSKKYRVMEGTIAHSGYYPAWELTLDAMHEFGTKDYKDEPQSKGTLSVRPQVACFADLGALLPLTPQIDLFLGGYFNIIANDANSSERRDIGWRDTQFDFMDEYAGAYATTNASASHPWEVGVKVGVHWHYIKPDKHEIIDYFDYFTRRDTTVSMLARRDTMVTERIDTLTRAHIAKAAEEVEKFNKIYFDFDSYKLSEEAQNYLASIVGVLNKVPDAKIAIDGHASEEGQRRHNEKLAYNRAKAVAKFLVSQGIDKERVIVIGHGSLIPNEENVNHELPLDRRAEVKVVQKQSEIQ
ncbi:MAG: OmpA family protein [Paludibacteraceae bacterium]|nr:OmpA family protein [Paludibacteraceae bacterium]